MGVHQNICIIHVAIDHMSLFFREYISFYKSNDIGSRLEVIKGHSCDIEANIFFFNLSHSFSQSFELDQFLGKFQVSSSL